jgi:hypothetical protein
MGSGLPALCDALLIWYDHDQSYYENFTDQKN